MRVGVEVFECVDEFGGERVVAAVGEVDVAESLEEFDSREVRVVLLERVEVLDDVVRPDQHVVH